jgi:hypothetical protein
MNRIAVWAEGSRHSLCANGTALEKIHCGKFLDRATFFFVVGPRKNEMVTIDMTAIALWETNRAGGARIPLRIRRGG